MTPFLIGVYLSALSRRPWEWGRTDCLMMLADWIVLRRGVDLAASFRGTYADEAGCRAILARRGGVLRLVRETLASAGLPAVACPSLGDVAVVRAPCERRHGVALCDTGAIAVGARRFAILTPDRGVVYAQLPLRAAWRV